MLVRVPPPATPTYTDDEDDNKYRGADGCHDGNELGQVPETLESNNTLDDRNIADVDLNG